MLLIARGTALSMQDVLFPRSQDTGLDVEHPHPPPGLAGLPVLLHKLFVTHWCTPKGGDEISLLWGAWGGLSVCLMLVSPPCWG